MTPNELSEVCRLDGRDHEESGSSQHIFDEYFSQRPSFSYRRPWNPPTDIYETEEAIIIRMEIAGVHEKDIKVSVDGNTLTVQGHRYEEAPTPRRNYHLMEIHYGVFHRVFHLSTSLDRDRIRADYRNGFLLINIPRRMNASCDITISMDM